MGLSHDQHIAVCLYIRAHFQKYDAPIPYHTFKQRFSAGVICYCLDNDILREIENCYPHPMKKGELISGLDITFHGLWILFKLGKRIKT